jgi:hypothetical protein
MIVPLKCLGESVVDSQRHSARTWKRKTFSQPETPEATGRLTMTEK